MRFANQTGFTLVISLTIQAVGLITGVITARTLGPIGRGELASIILWPTLLSNLGVMGCSWALSREVTTHPEKEADLLRASFLIGATMALLYMIVGYYATPYLLNQSNRYLTELTRLYLWIIPLDIFQQLLSAVDLGAMRWKRYNYFRLSFYVLYMLVIFFIMIAKINQVQWFVVALLLGHLISLSLRIGFQWRTLIRGQARLTEGVRLLSVGFPYFLSTASNTVASLIDSMLVVSLLPTKEVGIYAVAATFPAAFFAFGEALSISCFSALANEVDAEKQKSVLAERFRQATLTNAVICVLLVLSIPALVNVLFGVQFVAAITPAITLVIAGCLNALSGVLNYGLRGLGRAMPGFVSQVSGTIVVVVVALILSPTQGLMGMTWAMISGACVQLVVLVAQASVLFRLKPVCLWGLRIEEMRILYSHLIAVLPWFTKRFG